MTVTSIRGSEIPQISIDNTKSRAKCLALALDATRLADSARSLYSNVINTTSWDIIPAVLQSAKAACVVGIGISCSSLPIFASCQPIVLGVLISIGLAQVIRVCLSVYRYSVGQALLRRAYEFENLAFHANGKAAQLPTWKEPSIGILPALWSLFFSGQNGVTNFGGGTLNGRRV